MAKLEKQSDKKGMYLFWCPGCKCAHYWKIQCKMPPKTKRFYPLVPK